MKKNILSLLVAMVHLLPLLTLIPKQNKEKIEPIQLETKIYGKNYIMLQGKSPNSMRIGFFRQSNREDCLIFGFWKNKHFVVCDFAIAKLPSGFNIQLGRKVYYINL